MTPEEFNNLSDKDKVENLKKRLAWFNDFADSVQVDHRAYGIACEYADEKEVERSND
jgi:hypothetical protein